MFTPSSNPSPTLIFFTRSTSFSRNLSAIALCRITRLVAVQRWPVDPNAPCAVPSTAISRSAASITTTGFLPPISHVTFARCAAACFATSPPTPHEPVNDTARIAGLFTNSSPTVLPPPYTRVITPFGIPASSKSSRSHSAQPGVLLAALKTTVLPATSAGAVFHTGMQNGKFHGVIQLTTPSGWRIEYTNVFGISLGDVRPSTRNDIP